jgi:hypothetical protein
MLPQRDAIAPNDLVLVHFENKPAFFARVEHINPDYKRGWWHVKLFVLALPMQIITWIIDDEQIRGADFTMGGIPVRIEKVIPPEDTPAEEPKPAPTSPNLVQGNRKQARILSLGKKPPSDEGDFFTPAG